MTDVNLFLRIKRTYRCQLQHLCTRVLNKYAPTCYFDHPAFFTNLWYYSRKGVLPKLKSPRDFNEQLLAINLDCLKDENRRNIRIQCADKIAVREYITQLGFEDILNDCIGVYDSYDEINFDKLPDQFVLKLNSGSGQNYICKNKSDIDFVSLRSLCDKWIRDSRTFGLTSAEWHYSLIKPKLIIEKYLYSLGEDTSLIDYKFHCFNGKIAGVLVCYDRIPAQHQVNLDYYDPDWNLTDGILPQFHKRQRRIPKPQSFSEMKRIAETISKGIDYVRVDLYEIEGKPVFGEMTFTPAGNVMAKYQQWVLNDLLSVYKETMND